MTENPEKCILCRGRAGDAELGRLQVWEDDQWRLTTVREGELLGFSYLEPKRHIPHVTDLDGEEARTFGPALARTSAALQTATGSEVVYVYVFGDGVPHLHLHLAPHRAGDPLSDQMIRGEVVETKLPNGATSIASKEFPVRPAAEHARVIERVRALLGEPKPLG